MVLEETPQTVGRGTKIFERGPPGEMIKKGPNSMNGIPPPKGGEIKVGAPPTREERPPPILTRFTPKKKGPQKEKKGTLKEAKTNSRPKRKRGGKKSKGQKRNRDF